MILNSFNKSQPPEVPQMLYSAVVEQARQPAFFLHHGFADTVTGRFDCLALHLYLFTRRLVADPHPLAASLNQEVFDHFVRDTDRALRELGVGDTSVAKRNKKLLRGFYAMVDELGAPLGNGDETLLAETLAARFKEHEGDQATFDASVIARYTLDCAEHLQAQDMEAILAGRLTWPDVPPRKGRHARNDRTTRR